MVTLIALVCHRAMRVTQRAFDGVDPDFHPRNIW
jgi:hypothetical protein